MFFQSSIKLTISRLRRRIFRHSTLVSRVIVAIVAAIVFFAAVRFLLPAGKLAKEFLFGPVNIFSVILRQGPTLRNDNGRTNILLLGIGGAGHEGPNLTDAIIVLSIKTKLNEAEEKTPPPVFLLSVPRDIYLDALQDKINFAYQAGLDKGVGTTLIKTLVSQVTGLPVHYAVAIDFSAFDDIIDSLGGIDVNVEHTLDDYGYPIADKETDTCGFPEEEVATRAASISVSPLSEIAAFPCRYEHIHFDIGWQHMDGATVLKFIRSRHAEGDEGTDFARSRRQQLVLKAIKDKILSTDILLDPQKILDIYSQLKDHIRSDLDSAETNMLFNLALKYRSAPIKTAAIGEDLLENPPIDARGWILLPKDGSWEAIHQFVKKQLESQE